MRTLCEDLAVACGTVGHMGALLREAAGPFVLYESRMLSEVEADPAGSLVPPERVIPIPTVVLDGRRALDFRAGRLVPLEAPPGDTHVFVRDDERALVGVVRHWAARAAQGVYVKLHYELPATAEYRDERKRHPLVVAVGVFDGYHRGHQAIVQTLLRTRRAGERSAVVTFLEHPTKALRPGHEPPQIATLAERINAFARAGVDETFVLRFDRAFAALSPEAFLDDVIAGSLGARALVVGQNFRFGAGRAGDVAFAQAHLAKSGGIAIGVPNVLIDGERVSSTRVRAALAAGDGLTADRLLGTPYLCAAPSR